MANLGSLRHPLGLIDDVPRTTGTLGRSSFLFPVPNQDAWTRSFKFRVVCWLGEKPEEGVAQPFSAIYAEGIGKIDILNFVCLFGHERRTNGVQPLLSL